MSPLLLGFSLLFLLASILLEHHGLFAISLVAIVVSLAAVGGAPRTPLILFWVWVTFVLLYLLNGLTVGESEKVLILGIPEAAFCMLIGVGIVPVVLWPLYFLFDFKKWIGR